MSRQTMLPRAAPTPRVFEQSDVPHPAGLNGRYRRIVGEFWTARQKQMTPLHYVISYRASFKPELPAFFIERLCRPGGAVYDPFCGRGTTALQANLMGRPTVASDVNPLAVRISRAKCRPVPLEAVEERLGQVDWDGEPETDGEPLEDLAPFYHERTLRQLLNLRAFLGRNCGLRIADCGLKAPPEGPPRTTKDGEGTNGRIRDPSGPLAGETVVQSEIRNPKSEVSVADVDRFIELIALSRLHGHSDGFFSVYSFPQISVPPAGQRRINARRNQRPQLRPVPERILRKARRSVRGLNLERLRRVSAADRFFVADAASLPPADLPDNSVDLIVTSPPFLAKANYLTDNWLEFWFARIDPAPLSETLVQTPSLGTWRKFIGRALAQMARVLRPGGHAVIEVGEVVQPGVGLIHLDEVIVELASQVSNDECRVSNQTSGSRHQSDRRMSNAPSPMPGLRVAEVLIHSQKFTKLANCFNVTNNRKGTNTHRLVVLTKAS